MQGFNMGRYYPPDASNPPTFNASSHPLGKRANKISQGILTVRFELPFAVWCDHCSPAAIVGQGVRFNAEKKKVGNYYSTPIWSFRMKHSACGGWWEIRTDPKNAAYVVVEGAKKRDYGPEDNGAEAQGDLKFLTEEEKARRRDDAFANLEGKMEDKVTDKKNRERVEELYDQSEVWKDPYDNNARLRRGFREKRKVLKREHRQKTSMQDKFSLGLDIADETEADRMRARNIEFGGPDADDLDQSAWKPLFDDNNITETCASVKRFTKPKSGITAEKNRQALQQALIGNTKAVIDPFLTSSKSAKSKPTPTPMFSALKRKRDSAEDAAMSRDVPATRTCNTALLVQYDSD